jgi:hypothetical protein
MVRSTFDWSLWITVIFSSEWIQEINQRMSHDGWSFGRDTNRVFTSAVSLCTLELQFERKNVHINLGFLDCLKLPISVIYECSSVTVSKCPRWHVFCRKWNNVGRCTDCGEESNKQRKSIGTTGCLTIPVNKLCSPVLYRVFQKRNEFLLLKKTGKEGCQEF